MASAAEPANQNNANSRWYFSAEQLQNSPSRKCGIDANKELQYRQQTAYLIQEMGQVLRVSQLCINTAIVYMHRFYAFHSFTHFHRNGIAAAALFLAAKVEEQPRKLEHVIKVANNSLNEGEMTKEQFAEQAQDLVFNENVLLQTLGFDVAIDHPHTHVVKTCHLVKAGKDLAQTSYFMASNSLHLTTMCLQYKPTVVACFCIHLACKWSRWEIPNSTEGLPWFHYVDRSVTIDLLNELTEEFIQIYEKSPSRLKNKLNAIKTVVQGVKTVEASKASGGSQSMNSSSQDPNRNFQRPVSSSGSSNPSGNGSSSGHHHQHHHRNSSSSSSSKHPHPHQHIHGKSSKQFYAPPNPSGSAPSNSSSTSSSRNPMPGQMPPHRIPSSSSSSSSSMSSQQRPSQDSSSSGHKNRNMAPPHPGNKYNSDNKVNKNYQNLFGEPPTKTNSPSLGRHSNNGQQQKSTPPDLLKGNSNSSDGTFQFMMDENNLRGADNLDGVQSPQNPHKMKSIFSPEWKDDYMSGNTNHAKMNLPPSGLGGNEGKMLGNRTGNVSDHKTSSSSGLAPPPKPTTPTKKDRKMHDLKQQQQQQQAQPLDKKPINPLSNSISSNSQMKPSKRPFEEMAAPPPSGNNNNNPNPQVKEESDYREAKIRRSELEDDTSQNKRMFPNNQNNNKPYGELQPSKLGNPAKPNLDKYSMFSNSIQSIETNPDLVSSLLKESLNADQNKPFTTIPTSSVTNHPPTGYGPNSTNNLQKDPSNLLIKQEDHSSMRNSFGLMGTGNSLNATQQQQPLIKQEQQQMNPVDQHVQLGLLPNNQMPALIQPITDNGIKEEPNPTLALDPSTHSSDHQHHHSHKSDKKKKKDKHKHKDKDKSKDKESREERKKHKKDKERSKEHHSASSAPPPIKFTLGSNDRGDGSSGDPSQPGIGRLKIKISKEPSPQPSLKIKIPKNLIDNSNHNSGMGQNYSATNSFGPDYGYNSGQAYNTGALLQSSTSSSSHKKKDKDKVKRDY